jgi:carboxypeptidase Q
MMLEADDGLFAPVSLGVTGNQKTLDTVAAIASLLKSIGVDRVTIGGGGSDVDPSVQAGRMPSMSYDGTGNYFHFHHTQADTVDKIDPMDVSRAAAAIAVVSYVIADMPGRLGE